MPKRSFQQQRSTFEKNQIQPEQLDHTRRRILRWELSLIPPLLGIVFLGALIGAVHPVGQSILLGALLGALVGAVALVVLVLLVRSIRLLNINTIEINGKRNEHQSRRVFFWWSGTLLLAAIVGGILGSFFLPDTLPLFLKILLGAIIGPVGVALLIAIITDPIGFLEEFMRGFVEEGCCLAFIILFIAMTGTISGLLIWHSFLLGVLTGGGSVLVALTVFVGLAFSS